MRRLGTLVLAAMFAAHSSSSAQAPPLKPVPVKFDLLATMHIVVDIKINGKGPYRVIFDTGAPVNLINSKTAKDSGLIDKGAASPWFSMFGPVEQATIKSLEMGGLKAKGIPVVVMDHPTVELISKYLGPIEGIIGFPFFAHYKMTLDYQRKELTFVPSSYQPKDIVSSLLTTIMARDLGPVTRNLAPGGLCGFEVEKKATDMAAGVTVTKVFRKSAAAKAGLQVGDRLLTFDDRWTDSVRDCFAAAQDIKAGTEAKMNVRRAGKEIELTITPVHGL